MTERKLKIPHCAILIKHSDLIFFLTYRTDVQRPTMNSSIFMDQHFVFGGQIDHFLWKSFGLQKDVSATYQKEP
ncbi:hypothetical protein D5041_03180 [Verminephrobacter aporrectodeae subsp. tuberculatae]|nr:hypothetical protein [Verminephrobacter aporrectodeae subsp. tuberculatae]MCW5257131.1 hypothetical protein [Verminephrobacter aporrectodeae subsp. tuberculatae]MCW5288101.1 hypothetical protein [Verminephrobacter aporrectodeae subsp. tuberculatae]